MFSNVFNTYSLALLCVKTVSNVIVNIVLSVVLNIKVCYLARRNSSKFQNKLNIINTRMKKVL
jgi:hypothetical protein